VTGNPFPTPPTRDWTARLAPGSYLVTVAPPSAGWSLAAAACDGIQVKPTAMTVRPSLCRVCLRSACCS
jgi:hypothetical protein